MVGLTAFCVWLSQVRVDADLSRRGVKRGDRLWWIASATAFLPGIAFLAIMWLVLARI
jgi:hypothetical protein